MKFEKGQLQLILSIDSGTESKWLDSINKACEKFGIDTKLRLAAFIAQVGHESNRLKDVTENLNYSASGLVSTWPSRFDTFTANSCARNPEKIANVVYSNRMGNGASTSGDGWKYRGRGLIQCTGKANYDAFSQACGINAVSNPDSLATPDNAALSAAWFWASKGLNAYADRGDFLGTTKRINGGTIGEADRELIYKRALIVLSGGTLPSDAELAKKLFEVSPDSTSHISDQKTPGAQNSSIVEPRSLNGGTSKSQYPWNFVTESRSGHVSEIDDTPGNERVNMTHRTGSYWEVDSLGTFTHKSILDAYKLTKGDSYDYTGGSYTQQVKGQSYRQSSGDMIFKTDSQIYLNADKVQVNAGTLAVSGEIDAPSINANIFGAMSGLAFGDLLAKEALVAYDIIKGKAPMLGQSLGFKGFGGTSGSADGLMSNNLANKAPNGTPWITNGVAVAAAVVGTAAAAAAIGDIIKSTDPDSKMSNVLNSAANDLNAKATLENNQTPVFLKHVSFDKPTLFSQSTILDIPDPSLYVNNYHTIVDSHGVGKLHISNGSEWIPISAGLSAEAQAYTDGKISDVTGVINDNQQNNSAAIVKEAQDRAAALLAEASARADALAEEARARQEAIEQGLLTEAQNRGAAIQAESTIRQSAEQSLADHITTLTSSVGDNASAIQQEIQARSDAISAEASARQTLASTVNGNTASLNDEIKTRSDADTAITTRVTEYIASNDNAVALVRSDLTVQINGVNDALTTRIDSQESTNANNAALIQTESQTRVDADSALSSRIDTVFSRTDSNLALINTEVQTRTDADSALSQRIDTLVSTVGDNSALITTEQRARADGDSANAQTINIVSAKADNAQTTADGAGTAASNAQTAADNAHTAANNAQTAANNAQSAADAANSELANIASDNVLSKGEKPAVMKDYNVIIAEQSGIDSSADNFGLSRSAYDTAVSNLTSYLNGIAYTNTSTNTTIDGSTFRQKFSDVYANRQALLNSISAKAKSLADTAQTAANTAQTAANNAQTAANNAQTAANNAQSSANAANTELGNIASDNVLSKGEKSAVILDYNAIVNEQSGIDGQADSFGVSRSSYDTAITNLTNYLNGIGYSDTSSNSNIDGPTFRQKFSDVYSTRQTLLNAIAAKAKAIADAKSTVFKQSLTPTAKAVGDIWIDIGNQNRMRIWDGSTWVDVTDTRVTQNSADIVNEQNARASGDKANADNITTLSTTVGNHTTSIQTHQNSIDGISANYGVNINNNGVISGFKLLSTPHDGGATSSFIVEVDKFAIVPTGSGTGSARSPFMVVNGITYIDTAFINNLTVDKITSGTMNAEWRMNGSNARIVLDNGVVMKVIGTGFGANSDLIEWFGPSMAISQCTKANGTVYMGTDGGAYFGGSLSAGKLYNSQQTTQTAPNASVPVGPFHSNGNPRTVVVSYTFRWYRQSSASNAGTFTADSTPTYADIQIVKGGTVIGSTRITGNYDIQNGFGGDPGMAEITMSGSLTITDTGPAGDYTYTAQIANRSLVNISNSGGTVTTSTVSQTLSISSTEQ